MRRACVPKPIKGRLDDHRHRVSALIKESPFALLLFGGAICSFSMSRMSATGRCLRANTVCNFPQGHPGFRWAAHGARVLWGSRFLPRALAYSHVLLNVAHCLFIGLQCCTCSGHVWLSSGSALERARMSALKAIQTVALRRQRANRLSIKEPNCSEPSRENPELQTLATSGSHSPGSVPIKEMPIWRGKCTLSSPSLEVY